ncbi:MAG: SRPBCC family protein [Bacteroidota bacterium]
MNIKKEITVNKPIKQVWDILAHQYADAYKWARGLDYSEGHGAPVFEEAPFSNRTCEVPGFGKIQEVIRKFDNENHILSYEVVQGFPGFVASATNTWSLVDNGINTLVTMNMEMQTKGVMGAIMGPMMKMNLNKLIAGVISDFKVYLETGKPSRQKAREIEKAAKKAA